MTKSERGEIFSISGKGGEPYFMGGLDNRLAAMLYCFTLKFMSGYYYFPNNLKGIKGHTWANMISCKFFFQSMVTVFKENLNL